MPETTSSQNRPAAGRDAKRPRRRRRRGKPKPEERSAIAVLKDSRPPVTEKPADVPLTPAEIARMKSHFKFLRDHKKLLKLKLNASEDLLVNGQREPTHRGVCQHLLAKIERARVLSASERVSPTEATALLAGVLRFAPELPYLLRFLECVKASANRGEAASALTHALRHIDFQEISAAQMRQILSLIVEIFERRSLPIFLLSLLDNAPFRQALDRSTDVLAEPLTDLVLPLRALHRIFSPGRRGRKGNPRPPSGAAGEEALHGATLLLGVDAQSLGELPAASRRLVFELGCQAAQAGLDVPFDRMSELSRSLERDGRVSTPEMLHLASAMLSRGKERAARKLLKQIASGNDDTSIAGRWLHALEQARVGPIALDPPRRRGREGEPARDDTKLPPPQRWYRGWYVRQQLPVRVRYGTAGDHAEYERCVALWGQALVPGVSQVVAHSKAKRAGSLAASSQAGPPVGAASSNSTPPKATPAIALPFLAVALPGQSLDHAVKASSNDRTALLVWAREATLILEALARCGLRLPDANAYRFSVDDTQRLWLVDLWGVEASDVEPARQEHARLSTALAQRIFNPRDSAGSDLPEPDSVQTAADVLNAFGAPNTA